MFAKKTGQKIGIKTHRGNTCACQKKIHAMENHFMESHVSRGIVVHTCPI